MLTGRLLFDTKLYTPGVCLERQAFWRSGMNLALVIMFNISRIIMGISEATINTVLMLKKEQIFYKRANEMRRSHDIWWVMDMDMDMDNPMGYHNRILTNAWQGCVTMWLILGSSYRLLENAFRPLLWLALLTRLKAQFHVEPKGPHLARIWMQNVWRRN